MNKMDELINKIQQLEIGEKALKARKDEYRSQLQALIEATPDKSYDNALAKVAMTKPKVSRRVNYAGLKGYSEKVYNRFVTEVLGKPSMRIQWK